MVIWDWEFPAPSRRLQGELRKLLLELKRQPMHPLQSFLKLWRFLEDVKLVTSIFSVSFLCKYFDFFFTVVNVLACEKKKKPAKKTDGCMSEEAKWVREIRTVLTPDHNVSAYLFF